MAYCNVISAPSDAFKKDHKKEEEHPFIAQQPTLVFFGLFCKFVILTEKQWIQQHRQLTPTQSEKTEEAFLTVAEQEEFLDEAIKIS